MEWVSASKLKMYRSCPFRQKNEQFQRNQAVEFGSAVHAGIASFFQGKQARAAYDEEAIKLGLPIELFHRAQTAFGNLNHERVSVNPENIISIESSDFDVTFYGKKFFQVPVVDGVWGIRGSMDLVDIRDDGTLRILDWKTGQSAEEDDLQLAMYALAAWKKYPGFKRTETAFFYVEKNIYQASYWDEETLVGALEYVDGLARKFIAEKEFPQTPNKNCKWCSLNKSCDAFKNQLLAEPDRATWDLEAKPENLPAIISHYEKIDAIAKAAYGIAESLKEKRNELLKTSGPVNIGGRTYQVKEQVSRYEYDLPQIFVKAQEILGRPPIEICSFDSGAFDDAMKTLEKDQKKAMKEIKDSNKSVKSRSLKCFVSVAKDVIEEKPENAKEAEA